MNRGDRGQTTAFVAILALALLLVAGLVYDGGLLLAAKRRADNDALAAARAGAAVLAADVARNPQASPDPAPAVEAAHELLAAAGHHSGSVAVEGFAVTVTLTFDQPLLILGAAGLASRKVVGHGTARPARGVLAEEP